MCRFSLMQGGRLSGSRDSEERIDETGRPRTSASSSMVNRGSIFMPGELSQQGAGEPKLTAVKEIFHTRSTCGDLGCLVETLRSHLDSISTPFLAPAAFRLRSVANHSEALSASRIHAATVSAHMRRPSNSEEGSARESFWPML